MTILIYDLWAGCSVRSHFPPLNYTVALEVETNGLVAHFI